MPVPLKVKHRVHHMLQHPGTGHHTLLGNMPHHEDSDPAAFGDLHENTGGLPYLADASRGRGYLLPVHGLDGVNDCDLGLFSVYGLFNMFQAGFTQEFQFPCHGSDTVCPHLNLLQRLLT